MNKSILTLATVICFAGCTPKSSSVEDIWRDYLRETNRIHAEHDAAMAKIRKESTECRRLLEGLKIGSSELETQNIPCKESKINEIKTASATLDQWVYELADDQVVYLYYRNGKLTAIQD